MSGCFVHVRCLRTGDQDGMKWRSQDKIGKAKRVCKAQNEPKSSEFLLMRDTIWNRAKYIDGFEPYGKLV
jgi:hypothetical protein